MTVWLDLLELAGETAFCAADDLLPAFHSAYSEKRKDIKVHIFWESHKIWKKISQFFDVYLLVSYWCQKIGRFVQNFVAVE